MLKNNTWAGGSITTKNGNTFEAKMDLEKSLIERGYEVVTNEYGCKDVIKDGKTIGVIFKKFTFLHNFLRKYNIEWERIISKRLLPDNGLYILETNTFYIIECKYQSSAGSVDEKLQTCPFKLRQYKNLLKNITDNVNYCYILNDWFNQEQYKDVKDFILESGSYYFIEKIPFELFGL